MSMAQRPAPPSDPRITTADRVEPMYTHETLAARLGVSVCALDVMSAAGSLPPPDKYVRVGRRLEPRWTRTNIDRWIEGGGRPWLPTPRC
jgi:hypothetical protein